MNVIETIAAKIVALPLDQQCEVLEFVEFKLQRMKDENAANGWDGQAPRQRSSNFGSLAHLGLTVTDEDIAEVRREMWANFPREEPR